MKLVFGDDIVTESYGISEVGCGDDVKCWMEWGEATALGEFAPDDTHTRAASCLSAQRRS